jgi:hypothetical protein
VGPECQSLGPTTPRTRRPPSGSGSRHLARAHSLTATISPPTVSLPPCRRRPPPLAAIKGAHPPPPPPWSTLYNSPAFRPHYATIPAVTELPRTARSGLSPTDSTAPQAPHRRVQPPHTASCRPPPPPRFPSDRPHLTVERVLPVSSSFPLPQNGSTTLPPCSPDPPHYTSPPGAAGI